MTTPALNLQRVRRVRRFYFNDMADKRQARHNFRAWLRSVTLLGDKWKCSPMQRAGRIVDGDGADS